MDQKKIDAKVGRRRALQILGAGSAAGLLGWIDHDTTLAGTKAPGHDVLLKAQPVAIHSNWFTPLNQRNWTWKSFTRGNHPIHMDCYDVFWDGEHATPNHPIPGVATNPHYDPQRKSLGDVQLYAKRLDLASIKPVSDPSICSTTYCLVNAGKEYLAYQPDPDGDITIELPRGNYRVETFDAISNRTAKTDLKWSGGKKQFSRPGQVAEDWVLYVVAR